MPANIERDPNSHLALKNKIFRTSILLIAICFKAYGQSPDITALNQYGGTPNSLYSGSPLIDIPFDKVIGQQLSVELGISYSPNGVRVEEYGSWVGLSWVLQGGGVISRSIQGVNDFGQNGHLSKPIPAFDIENGCENPTSCSLIDSILNGTQDSQPDVFYYYFGGNSGKFVINKEGNIELLSKAPLQIVMPFGETGEWEISLPDGTKYYFGGPSYLEKSEDDVIGWYLKRVESNLGEEILFDYEQYTYTYSLPETRMEYYKVESSSETSNCSPAFYTLQDRSYVIQSQYLSSIRLNDWEVKFQLGPRCDLDGAGKLDEIQYYYQGKKLKTFQFSYICNPNTKRLWLESVQEIGMERLSKPPYRFDYYNANKMPSVNSMAQDYWGYYNGADNENLIPLFNSHDTLYLEGAKRDTDIDKIQYGSLKRITFPSGGYQEFLFKPHRFQQLSDEAAYKLAERNYQVCLGGLCSEGNRIAESSFSLSRTTVLELQYHLIKGLLHGEEGGNNPSPDYIKVAIEGYNEPIEVIMNANGGVSDKVNIQLPKGSYSLKAELNGYPDNLDGHKAFLAIKYEDIVPDNSVIVQQGAGLRIEKITTYDGVGDSPPLVKRYSYHHPDDTDLSSGLLMTRFQYYYYIEMQDGEGAGYCTYLVRTSNNVNALPINANTNKVGYSYVTIYEGEEGSMPQGRVIYQYYNAVDEPNISESICPTLPSNQYGNQSLPNLPGFVTERKKGYLLKTNIERSYQGVYYPISETVYEYDEKLINNVEGGIIVGETSLFFSSQCKLVRFGLYPIESIQIQLAKQTSTIYDGEEDQVGNSLSKTINYQYRTSYPWQTLSVQEIAGEEEAWVYLSYAQDYNGSAMGGAIESMHEQELLMPIIDTQYWRKEENEMKLFGSELTLFSKHNNFILPSSSYHTTLKNPLETWTDYTGLTTPNSAFYREGLSYRYDNKGRVIQITKEGIPKSWIYDYEGDQILAEAANASIEQIAYNSFEQINHGGGWEGVNWDHITNNIAFTGNYVYQGSLHKSNLPSGLYTVALWAKGPDGRITVNGEIRHTDSDWKSYTWEISPTDGNVTINNVNCAIDDVRLHPVNAQMISYTYEPGIGISSHSDVNNKPVYFSYDNLHRKVLEKDHNGNVLKRYSYRYQGISGMIEHDEVGINQETLFQFHLADDIPTTNLVFRWDFGDGSPILEGKNVVHAYTKLGMYQVSLNIIGQNSPPIIRTVNVRGGLSADISVEAINLNNPVQFSAINIDDNPEGTTYLWDFGDGSNGSGLPISHTFDRLGTYKVRLIVNHPAYARKVIERDYTPNGYLYASIAASQIIPNQGVSKQYSASIGSNPIDATYTWDFGNGVILSGPSVHYAYPEGGNYTLKLSVSHPDYATSTSETELNVNYSIPVLDEATLTYSIIESTNTYNVVEVQVNPPNGGKEPIVYDWAIKDPSDSQWAYLGASNVPSYTFTFTKTTEVRVMARDDLNQDSQWVEKRVHVLIPTEN